MDLENKPNKQGTRIGGGYMVVVYGSGLVVVYGYGFGAVVVVVTPSPHHHHRPCHLPPPLRIRIHIPPQLSYTTTAAIYHHISTTNPSSCHIRFVFEIHLDSDSCFLAEWIEQQQPTEVHSEHWTMFFDGSKMLNGSGAGVVLVSPRGDKLRYVLQIHFDSSNNEAEYEALLYGLRMAISLGVRRLMVYGDSDLVVNQVMKEWDVRSPAPEPFNI